MDQLTYGEVGATRDGRLPAGFRHLRYRRLLGRDTGPGRDLLAAAGRAILTWRMHEAAGVRVRASAPSAEPGVRLTCALGLGPVRVVVPCRVVWTAHDDDRVGFAYGTLPGHLFRGEEAFTVTRTADGDVWFAVTAFSTPAIWYTRAAGPLTGLGQQAYARLCGRALARLSRQAPAR